MDAAWLVSYHNTIHHYNEDNINVNLHGRENLKSPHMVSLIPNITHKYNFE